MMQQLLEQGRAQQVDETIAHWFVLFFFLAKVTLRMSSPQLQFSSDGLVRFTLIAASQTEDASITVHFLLQCAQVHHSLSYELWFERPLVKKNHLEGVAAPMEGKLRIPRYIITTTTESLLGFVL